MLTWPPSEQVAPVPSDKAACLACGSGPGTSLDGWGAGPAERCGASELEPLLGSIQATAVFPGLSASLPLSDCMCVAQGSPPAGSALHRVGEELLAAFLFDPRSV